MFRTPRNQTKKGRGAQLYTTRCPGGHSLVSLLAARERFPENHFYIMKDNLGDDFKVLGYYLEEKLVGFYTLILNNKQLETYFLGYDTEHQYTNQLYLNMLYDMVKYGVEHQFSSIVYARTAMAIKSSVGAKSRPMEMYMKHTNSNFNKLLKPIFGLMNPHQDWEERHPFK